MWPLLFLRMRFSIHSVHFMKMFWLIAFKAGWCGYVIYVLPHLKRGLDSIIYAHLPDMCRLTEGCWETSKHSSHQIQPVIGIWRRWDSLDVVLDGEIYLVSVSHYIIKTKADHVLRLGISNQFVCALPLMIWDAHVYCSHTFGTYKLLCFGAHFPRARGPRMAAYTPLPSSFHWLYQLWISGRKSFIRVFVKCHQNISTWRFL